MTRVGMVARAPHEDSSVIGDQVGKGDMSDIKSYPQTAGYNGPERNQREHFFLHLHTTKERRSEKRGLVANPKKETEFLDERKHVSLEGGEALWTREANLGGVAILPG